MHNTSKKLKNRDLSGDFFSQEIFSHNDFSKIFLDFDRIQMDFRTNSWVIIDHILIDTKINHFEELPLTIKSKIKKIISFSNLLKENSKKNTQIIIDLYFSKNSEYKNTILLIKDDYSLQEINIKDFSLMFREVNFFGERKNVNQTFHCNKFFTSERIDDSAFSLSQFLLSNDLTYGFNIDKILYLEDKKEIYLFEYLLCEEHQTVTPYTSHPNRYFLKNSNKFINLFTFSQDLKSPLYLLNYAKPNTKNHNEILWMKVLKVDANNSSRNFVDTQNKKTTIEELSFCLNKKFLHHNLPKLKI